MQRYNHFLILQIFFENFLIIFLTTDFQLFRDKKIFVN